MQRKEDKQFRLIDLLDDLFAGRDVFFKSVCLVKDMMTEDVKALTLDDTIEMCIKFMKENRVRHIPVIDSPTGEERRVPTNITLSGKSRGGRFRLRGAQTAFGPTRYQKSEVRIT